MKILLVGGTFDDDGGRPSGYITKLDNALMALSAETMCINGGQYNYLEHVLQQWVPEHDVVLWFADVPNGMEKMAHRIKQINPKCILVTSKRNERVIGEADRLEYPFQAVVAHALRLKANLVVQFCHDQDRRVLADVFDPLGNHYNSGRQRSDIQQVARTLLLRIKQLSKFTRQGSLRVGDKLDIPDEHEFFGIIKQHAETFHELLNPQQTDRFLGNASFRCARGFPSFRGDDDHIFVSRRNVDKRYIGQDAFVAVANTTDQVRYWGNVKPSVDTPIQLRLYRYYREINYMVHGHVYAAGAYDLPTYDNPIPCGAIEEVDHICCFDRDIKQLAVNVRNHGCIIMSATAPDLAAAKFRKRPAPEHVGEH